MLYLEFLFPLGRYHATPWGRHVNEGVVEWPPSPFRIARAIAALAWVRRSNWTAKQIENVLKIFELPPVFALPPATTSHIRAYLSQNTKNVKDKTKIFDAFVVMEPLSSIYAGYEASVDEPTKRDLAELLEEMNYLGRSESWVQARLLDTLPEGTVFNCAPNEGGEPARGQEIFEVAGVRPEHEYQKCQQKPRKGKGKVSGWMEALCMDTGQWIDEGWNEHPCIKPISYLRPAFSRVPQKNPSLGMGGRFSIARFALDSTVLPQVTEAIAVAERVRVKLMGIDRRMNNGNGTLISPQFSGKKNGKPDEGHEHAYILPLDEDGDGRLDHVLIRSRNPFGNEELRVLDRCTGFWQQGGRPDVHMLLVGLLQELPLSSRKWVSHTPFVTRRHWREGRGTMEDWLASEIRKECVFHGLPEPVEIRIHPDRQPQPLAHPYFWVEFLRSRKNEKPLRGHGFTLLFDQDVRGPFALGALAHFGLGTFVPAP